MKQETKKPLYKVLNEQRTSGEWYCDEGSFIVRKHIAYPICEFKSLDGQVNNDKRAANAQYTALAVNNLALLADIIENSIPHLRELMEWWDRESESFEDNEKQMCLNNAGDVRELIGKAKEALNRIS